MAKGSDLKINKIEAEGIQHTIIHPSFPDNLCQQRNAMVICLGLHVFFFFFNRRATKKGMFMRAGGRGQTSLKAQGALGFPHGLEPHPSSLIAPCIQSMSLTKSGAPGRAGHGPYSSPRVYAKHLDRKRINFVKYLQDPRHNGRHQPALLKGTQCSHYVFSPYYFVICNSFQRIKERPHATLNGPTGYEMYPDLRSVTCGKMQAKERWPPSQSPILHLRV